MNTKMLLLVLNLGVTIGFAQEARPPQSQLAKNTVYLELGGNGIIYSINYDRLLTSSPWFKSSARFGLVAHWWNGGAIGVPLEISGLIGKTKHFLEIGTGTMYSYGIESLTWRVPNDQGKEGIENFSAVHISGRIGYRFQRPEGGLFIRAAYTPTARIYTNNSAYEDNERGFNGFWTWFGVGVGKTF